MKSIKIPNHKKKRALIVVDVQPAFITAKNKNFIPIMKKVIKKGGYELFVESTFHAPPNSIWDRQMKYVLPYEPTVNDIKGVLDPKRTISIMKTTKSPFATDHSLSDKLREKGIEEVNIIGFDTHDCVIATAYDSFDAGFVTYVIEEATGSSKSNDLKKRTMGILREVEMTNFSKFIKSTHIKRIK